MTPALLLRSNGSSLGAETRQIAMMVAAIALIHFVIEAFIMGLLSNWNLTRHVVVEGMIDCTLLTMLSSPPIYLWVARPFIVTARTSEAALARELQTQSNQAQQLEAALADLKQSLGQNEDLRLKLQQSNDQAADVNERTLQRIGGDLHDGPAQLLTYSLMRLGKFTPLVESIDGDKGKEELDYMRVALTDTLTEVRNISRGLSLPHLDDVTLAETVSLAVTLHREQTGSRVELVTTGLPQVVPQPVKVCAYRIVQESLTNAYRHGKGTNQKVVCSFDKVLNLEISDSGPGFDLKNYNRDGLGLSGMRSRVGALGGTLDVITAPGSGTLLRISIDIDKLRQRELINV
jgi:signal transduction histidine kinase